MSERGTRRGGGAGGVGAAPPPTGGGQGAAGEPPQPRPPHGRLARRAGGLTATTAPQRTGGAGFWVCNFAFTFERFAYYAAKWLIFQFIVATAMEGGLGAHKDAAASYQSFFVAFTYLAPLLGSYISDHLIGAKYLVPVGMVLMGIGYLLGWQAHSLTGVAIMIALVSVGTGLFKPQTNSITGRLFSDPRDLDKAFSTQYSMVNIGSFLGTTFIGILAGTNGYRICFLVCAVAMFIDAVMFFSGWGVLGEAGAKPFKLTENSAKAAQTEKKEAGEARPLTRIEKQRVAAIIAVSAFSAIFWIFWYLAYLPDLLLRLGERTALYPAGTGARLHLGEGCEETGRRPEHFQAYGARHGNPRHRLCDLCPCGCDEGRGTGEPDLGRALRHCAFHR